MNSLFDQVNFNVGWEMRNEPVKVGWTRGEEITAEINDMTNLELLEAISIALEDIKGNRLCI